MSSNGMNYPMYNTLAYSHMAQQQSLYGQRFPNHHISQPPMPQYSAHQMYPSMQPQSQYNSYDHIVRSAAETLAAFTRPPELPMNKTHQPRISQQNPTRRPPTNSSGATNPTRMYYCETCRIACGGHASYQAHLNGSKHKKKEVSSQNPQASANVNSKSGGNTFRCELCDITCTSSDAYKAHLEGSKHDKAMKLHRKLGKVIPPTEPQIVNSSSAVVTDSQTLIKEEKVIVENNIKPVGEEYIEITYDNTKKPILYHCKLCDCKFNDSNGKDAHLKGKRHRLSYKKKVNPKFQMDGNNNNNNNKAPSPKQRLSETIENINNRQINYNQTEIDDNTKCLMMFHQQIIPSQNLLNTIEQFINAVVAALKTCSDQLSPSQPSTTNDTPGAVVNKSPLMGVSRLGPFAKNLILKSDRLFSVVVICAEWPTIKLFEKIFSILSDSFPEPWKNKIEIQCRKDDEIIQVQTNTDERSMSVLISFTSPTIQQHDNNLEQVLSKTNCLNTLDALHSVRWFDNQISTRQHAPALIRCLRNITKVSTNWKSLSSEAIEILIEHTLTKSVSAVCAFQRVLEYLAGGLVLPNGPGLRVPWQTNSIKDVFENLTLQERNDITQEAQIGLRLMAFGQLNKWLEQYNIPELMMGFEKRSYSDHENEGSAKRQCTESEKHIE